MMTNNVTVHESALLKEKYYTFHHQSGLTVHVFPKALSTTYAILGTGYGAVDSAFYREGELLCVPDGIAHFLEHKMFEAEDGTDAFEHFAAVGANANAYTSSDMTAYLFSAADRLEEALRELLVCVTTPHFTKENVEKEMDIIGQEIQMHEDSPNSRLYYLLLEGLYQNHPIKRNIAGSRESIKKITPELLYECYETFYQPSNMVLVVCGNATVENVCNVVDEVLAKGEEKPIRRFMPEEEKAVASLRPSVRMEVARPLVAIGTKDMGADLPPLERERRGICVDLVNDMLFGKSGALYERLYSEGLISDDFAAEYEMLSSCAFNAISCECEDPERLLKEIGACIADAMENPPSKEEFERLKRCYYSDYVRGFDSTEEIANELLTQALRGLDLFAEGELIADVTYEETIGVMREVYGDSELVCATVLPLED